MEKRVLLFLVVSFFYSGLSAQLSNQNPYENLVSTRFKVEEGLSQSNVYSIIKDSEGYIWIGTENGLNRFDGYDFKVFRNNPDDSTSIGHNWIRRVYEDSQHRLWVGANDGGLNLFDRKTETFNHFKAIDSNNSILNNGVLSILEDLKGQMWFGTYEGLSRLNDDEQTFTQYNFGTEVNSYLANSIKSLAEDKSGRIWVGTQDGLHIIEKNEIIKSFEHNPNDKSGLSNDDISGILVDKENRVWLGTNGGGLNLYEEKTGTFRQFTSDPKIKGSISSNDIVALKENESGDLIIGTNGSGINVLSKNGYSFSKISSINDNELFNVTVYDIFLDENNMAWIGSYGSGVKLINMKNKNFSLITSFDAAMDSIGKRSVLVFVEDIDQNIWIGTDGGGLYKFNPINRTFKNYLHDQNDKNSLSSNVIKSLMVDDNGLIYAGTYAAGLNILNPKNNQVKRYYHDPKNPQSINSNNVWSILKDQDGRIWLGTNSRGLDEFIPEKEIFLHLVHEQGNPKSLSSDYIPKLYEDSQKNLWIGTNRSISRFDKIEISFQNYNDGLMDSKGINNFDVRDIAEDIKGNLWFTSYGGGLYYYEEELDTFINNDPNNEIIKYGQSLLIDNNNNFWIGTINGIVKYNPSTKTTINYNVSDGLQGNEFNYDADLKSSSGIFYMGGLHGFNFFNPDEIIKNQSTPPVVLTNIYLFHKEINTKNSIKILNNISGNLDKLILAPDQNVVSFKFATLEYSFPKKNKYAYMLEGFDKDWNYIGEERIATFMNLAPGEYTLKLKSTNNEGVWGDESAKLTIVMLPPWYSKTWVQAIFVISFILLILSIIRIRTTYLYKQKTLLEREVKRRTLQVENKNLEIAKKNLSLQEQNEMITSQNDVLTHKNEEINAQREQIEMKSQLLLEAHKEIKKANEELKNVNTNLEDLVDQRTMELKKAMKKLIETDEGLNTFLYRSSHDLRGPITTLQGLSQLAMRENNDPHIEPYFHKINNACRNMLKFLKKLNQTNELFRAGKSVDHVNWNKMLSEINADLKMLYPNQHVQKTLVNYLTVAINSDETLIKAIISNLMENAIVFNNNPSPFVELVLYTKDKKLVICVIDNGMGLQEDIKSKLFEMFYRGSERSIGNGLGLFLVKRAVEILEGEIEINSLENELTSFTVTIPITINKDVKQQRFIKSDTTFQF